MKSFNELYEEEHKKMMKKLMVDPLIKKIIRECKEVKKMKPYLEMKVVKVRKPKPKLFMCKACGTILPAEKPKGNWVNGENLDEIRFPCFCSYIEDKKKYIGMINCYVDEYGLYNMEKQSKDNFIDDCTSLENLIKSYNIHILKGKIIIWEE